MMKHSFPLVCSVLSLLSSAAVLAADAPDIPELRSFRAPIVEPQEHVRGFLWLEAESFADYGEWKLDTQFTHKMGSAYLLAPGVLKPIADAHTSLTIPTSGDWHVWVRTKDWLPEFSPGRFAVRINGQISRELGASKQEGWGWEKAGAFTLPAGRVEVALVDLSGAFARCDAILFTQDGSYVPPTEATALQAERLRLTGCDGAPSDGGMFDVVVVGAGPAGMGAALSAARTGARTALVHDRPVLGGNSSCELGVGTDGAAGSHPNAKLNARETGLCEEANLRVAQTKERTLSASYRLMVSQESNLTVCSNQRVLSVEKNGDVITAVIARNTLTGAQTRYRAAIVIDCTGDGWVGRFADAAYMYGREARNEYNEEPAPEERDDLTMSGCLMGGCLAYRYVMRAEAVPYATPAWANVLPEGFTRQVRNFSPSWWIEHGGRFDDLADPERARDELVRIVFAYWGWLKNEWSGKASCANAELSWIPYMNARREGFRLVGDYVLTANDALEGRMFPDRISYGGWPLDTHDPLGMENPHGNGYWRSHPGVPVYSIPYRVLYSKTISNLMIAGRCQSVTHVALGSVRVEATLFTLGQAAGTAAALALAKGMLPREYGQKHIAELQQRLLKDDQYIPELRNDDPADLARSATVTATSVQNMHHFTRTEMLEHCQRNMHELNMPRATCFARHALERLDSVECLLESTLDRPVELTAKVYVTDNPKEGLKQGQPVATVKATVPARHNGTVAFVFAQQLKLTQSHVWVELPPMAGVSWKLRDVLIGTSDCRAYGGAGRWTIVDGQQYAVLTNPELRRPVDSRPEYVIDGVSRPVDECVHGWISAAEQPLPQSLQLDWGKLVDVREVRLTFDTNLTPKRVFLKPYPPQLVKAYTLEGYNGQQWIQLAEVPSNGLRHCIHRFPVKTLSKIRLTVKETWGDVSARVFEVRVY